MVWSGKIFSTVLHQNSRKSTRKPTKQRQRQQNGNEAKLWQQKERIKSSNSSILYSTKSPIPTQQPQHRQEREARRPSGTLIGELFSVGILGIALLHTLPLDIDASLKAGLVGVDGTIDHCLRKVIKLVSDPLFQLLERSRQPISVYP